MDADLQKMLMPALIAYAIVWLYNDGKLPGIKKK